MKYIINELSRIAGVSARTLRYYDEIGLLMPEGINSSGYRVYGKEQVDLLQQILFFRELGVDLRSIKEIIRNPEFNALTALVEHRNKLLAKKEQLQALIANVEKSIAESEGGQTMDDKEKFEGFKQRMLDENESKYGEEVRQKYGTEAVERSNKAFKNMTEKDYKNMEELGVRVNQVLHEAFLTGDASGELAQQAAGLHRQWLTGWWGYYDKDAHAGLAQMYVDDERFRSFYDKEQPGTAEFLRDAIQIYTSKLD